MSELFPAELRDKLKFTYDEFFKENLTIEQYIIFVKSLRSIENIERWLFECHSRYLMIKDAEERGLLRQEVK